MDGWTFAAIGLVVVLLGELLLFRYVDPDRMPTLGAGGAAEPGDPTERRVDGVSQSGGGTGEADSGAVVGCRHCGTANADAPAVVFCRSCLGRLR